MLFLPLSGLLFPIISPFQDGWNRIGITGLLRTQIIHLSRTFSEESFQ